MRWMRAWFLRFHGFFRKPQHDAEFTVELESHLQLHIEDNLRRGMTPETARREALMKLGGVEQTKENYRDRRGLPLLEALFLNLRFGSRMLLKSPGSTGAVVIALALGIGASTAMFTVVRSVLLRPLPFKEPARLIHLYEHTLDDKWQYNQNAAGIFAAWKSQSHGFSDLAIYSARVEYNLSGTSGQLPEKIRGAECSWELFPTLGVEPALGRGFTAEDDSPSANGTVVLSWALWKRRFGGDSSILNQTIRLDARSYTVIGVMPAWFTFPQQRVQLWTPVYHEESSQNMQAVGDHEFKAVGRLKPGVAQDQATAELSVITRQIRDQHMDDPFVSKGASSRPLLEGLVGDIKTSLYVLLGATLCVLLIACLNVASLLVARSAVRRKELAIRSALGGSRWRLLGEHLTESFLLSSAGGVVGLWMAYGALRWFVSTRPDVSRAESIHMDAVVGIFVTGLVFLCAFLAGSASSASIEGGQVLCALQESSRSHSAGLGRIRLRKWLLSLEVGLTVMLLIGAGLLLKSYKQLRSSHLGCVTDNALTMRFSLPETKYSQPIQRVSFFENLLERVRAVPGIQAAGLVRAVPGAGYAGDSGFAVGEHPQLPQGQEQDAMVRWADPGYFAALGIPLLRGQTFDSKARLDGPLEVIISDSLAREYFPGEDPIGKHLLTLGKRSFQIVGIVGDTRFVIAEVPQPMMYFPIYSSLYEGNVPNRATLAVRSSRDVTSFALPIQKIVQQLDSELAVSDVLTMDQVIGKTTVDASFDAALLLAFAVLSLSLASIGLFGVLSYIVGQRTSEIGIRLALGAQRGELLRLTLVDGLKPAGFGLVLGLAGAAAAVRMISSLLYGVQPLDATVFIAVAILLLSVAAIACLLPAWRASRVDPITALRYE
ncbi:MAG TPA: ABC transporter permease [Candidatus Acidoferrum sp.]|nr:ABC transporter permease [Candidatus Acidoferrum sp.]